MAIQIRRGTNTEWESNNSNIVVGEPAIATDAERFFVGTASGDYAEFANLDVIAPAYDTSTSYVVGDIINYHGKLYSCNTPCSGAFNASYWDEKSLAEILKDLENEITYAQYEIGYASGKLITVGNGASEIPVKDLTVDIEASQNLHGYDYPWVGGAGKNKLPFFTSGSSGGVTFTVASDGSVKASGTASGTVNYAFDFTVSETGSYTLSGCPSGGGASSYQLWIYDRNTSASTGMDDTGSGATGTLDSTHTYSVRIRYANGYTANQTFYPMLRKATDSAGYEPYSNICPISGWDEVNVNVRGINMWDEEWELGGLIWGTGEPTLATDRIRSKNFCSIKPSTTYYAKNDVSVFFYDLSKAFISYVQPNNSTFTTPNNAYYFKLIKLNTTTYNHDISINYPNTDHDYHEYNGQTYAIDLNDTRYGGMLDVTTGVLTLTHGYVDLGTLNWTKQTVAAWNCFSSSITDKNKGGTVICSNYPQGAIYGTSTDKIVGVNANSNNVYVRDSSYMSGDTSAFKTAMNGVQLVYELATPQVVQLTPTQVRTVLGTNNLWNQMNSNNELAYRISNALN